MLILKGTSIWDSLAARFWVGVWFDHMRTNTTAVKSSRTSRFVVRVGCT
jgi:hypothetical protein